MFSIVSALFFSTFERFLCILGNFYAFCVLLLLMAEEGKYSQILTFILFLRFKAIKIVAFDVKKCLI